MVPTQQKQMQAHKHRAVYIGRIFGEQPQMYGYHSTWIYATLTHSPLHPVHSLLQLSVTNVASLAQDKDRDSWVFALEVLTGLGQDGGCKGSAPIWIPGLLDPSSSFCFPQDMCKPFVSTVQSLDLGCNDSTFCLCSYSGQPTLLAKMSTLNRGFGPQCQFQPDVPSEFWNVTYSTIP